ncbi:MAG: zinc-binding dehydrogenase [Panacagrimonas sp.]
MSTNRRVILAERPKYFIPTENCFRMDTAPMPQLAEDGDVLLQTTWLAMESTGYSKVQRISAVQRDPIRLKDPMMGSAVGRVVESRHPRFKPGDFASGLWGWQDYAVVKGERLRNLDFGPQRPSLALGAYGYSGFAADISLEILAPPSAGETVVVGTAMGNFGHLAGQMAKLKGCRVVGIVGSAEKCQLAVEKLGLDACVNRNAKDFEAQLAAACPKGVDVYLETYGGRPLEAVMPLLNLQSRIAAVGQMASTFRGDAPFKGRYQITSNFVGDVIARRISVRGLVTTDHVKGRVKMFDNKMKAWIDEGKITPMEEIIVGLEKAPEAFLGVFDGKNRGTRVVKVAD